ncbi:MAG TPA: hypothetical protein VFK52_08925 [Nocardioidaceae bacterium]|nr:hypothetical protein [Nocardioidaceae bacterium]
MRSREQILAEAEAKNLRHVPQPELEVDATNGGYAFEDERGNVVVLGYDGAWAGYALTSDRPTVESVVSHWLAQARHRNRHLVRSELGVWQQAAVAAAEDGTTVAALGLPLDEADTDYAESLRIVLGRSPAPPMRALAAQDYLLEHPVEGRRYTHACPLCGSPALHTDRYPRSVCDSCYARTADSQGRLVTGANTAIGGGFVAHFAGTSEVCTEVTATKRCWVDGRACRIDEAHMGGVVVEAL